MDIFIPKLRAFDQDASQHTRQQPLQQGGRPFSVASPENMIINKLEWYEMGGRVSTRQWNDILGMLRAQEHVLDMAYLDHWASTLGLKNILEDALVEAGFKQP